jgi:hypothetical protein
MSDGEAMAIVFGGMTALIMFPVVALKLLEVIKGK